MKLKKIIACKNQEFKLGIPFASLLNQPIIYSQLKWRCFANFMTTEFQNVVLGKFASQPLKMKKKLSNLQTKTSFKERAMSSLIFLCSSIACSVMKSIRNSLTFLKIQILSLRHLNWLPKLLGLIGLLSLLSGRKDKLISLTFLAILTNKV